MPLNIIPEREVAVKKQYKHTSDFTAKSIKVKKIRNGKMKLSNNRIVTIGSLTIINDSKNDFPNA